MFTVGLMTFPPPIAMFNKVMSKWLDLPVALRKARKKSMKK